MNTASHDFTATPTKHLTRVKTLELVKGHTGLFRNGKLVRDWMELASEQDPTFGLLRDHGVLGQYIGVNFNQGMLDLNAAHYPIETAAGQALWVQGNIHVLLAQPIASNVGVLVYDGYDGVKSQSDKMYGILRQLCSFALTQHQNLGQFMLVLNFSLRGANNSDVSLHLDRLRHFMPGIQITPDNLHIYQSEGRTTKMMLCRIGLGFTR